MGAFASTYASAAELQYEMLPGETLLWSGQPQLRVLFHQQDLFVIPFSLLWGGFAIFWEWAATGHFGSRGNSLTGFFALWGLPFVLLGQYMIWGRFLYTAWRKSRTYYGLTNRRVLVINAGNTRKVTDGYLSNLSSVSISTRTDGTGTIEFAPEPDRAMNGLWGYRRSRSMQMDIDLSRLAFFDVENVRAVYQLIQEQRQRVSPL